MRFVNDVLLRGHDTRRGLVTVSAIHLALFYTAYVLAGGFGQGLALIPGVAITFWPPAGIFLATLLLNPRGSWPW
jgi:integral membrane sensor domain MASE1